MFRPLLGGLLLSAMMASAAAAGTFGGSLLALAF